jgi:ribosomal protein S18 acetylase RimI-like enzyme
VHRTDEISYHDTQDVDIFQLARLLEQAGWHNRSRDTGRLAKLVSGSTFIVSAWHGDRLVGFARAISDGVSHAYISDVAVLEDYRRRGIAREILRRIVLGRDEICFVLHARPDLEAFCTAAGFQVAPDVWRRPPKA